MDGTLEFMAPEVIRSTYCTTATDMWSLGCEGNIIRDNLDMLVFQCPALHAGLWGHVSLLGWIKRQDPKEDSQGQIHDKDKGI